MIGVAVALVASALTLASMGITTTSGAGTDEVATPTAVPTVAAPPQAPIEPVATTNDGGQQGAGAAPGELPDAGYGASGTNTASEAMTLLALGGAVLVVGAALMAAGTRFNRREQ
jgi:hypothetical protein